MQGLAQPVEPAPNDALAELSALHALAEAINRSDSLAAVYPEALQALRRLTRADRAAVLLLDDGGAMRFVAWHGLSDRYRAAVEGHSPWAANEEDPRPILTADLQKEASIAHLLPVLREEGIASLAFVPIAHQGRLFGKLMLYFDSPHEMAAGEVRLALTVAEYLALALSRQRAVEEIRRLNADLEARVEQRTRQLEEANREIEAFCHSVSHDLRSPLRALDGFARILLEDAGHVLDEGDRGNLRRIIAASERMGRLMDDLLRLLRVGRVGMRLADTDLGVLAAEVVDRLRGESPDRRIDVRIGDDLRVRADAGLMRIALENLLENAWKHTRRCEEARIEFGRRECGGDDCYFVRDNGAGFDMDYAAKLFSPFRHVHPPAEYEGTGTGIGLAIVQRIVQRHGGRIWAESAPGRGSTFYFTLWAEGMPAELRQEPTAGPVFPLPSSPPA